MPDLWLHGQLDESEPSAAQTAIELGVRNVVTGASATQAQLLREAGAEPWVAIGAFSASKDETDLLCQSLTGERRIWFGSGCPSNPRLQQRLVDRVKQISDWDIEGILLDGIRFASPYEGIDTFLTCTCQWCRSQAAKWGFAPDTIPRALRSARQLLNAIGNQATDQAADVCLSPIDALPLLLSHPELTDWLRFRMLVIADVVSQVRRALDTRTPRKRLGAYLFPPSLAALVGQHYPLLAPNLDIISPMLYRFGDGPACLPSETLALASFLPGANPSVARMAVLRMLGLVSDPHSDNWATTGMPLQTLSRESQRARSLVGRQAYLLPILWLDDPQIEAASAATMSGSPNGISFFSTGQNRTEHLGAAARYFHLLGNAVPSGSP